MKANMGTTDRILRIVAAVVILLLYFTGQLTSIAAAILLIFAAVFILTGFLKFCPLYLPFGLSTCK